ncbi:MAG: PAS domain S-box protein, partial [Candidatus Odinarchaeota archaeon]
METAEEKVTKIILAVEQLPAMIMITDTSGIIEYVNKEFVQITGYNAEEVIGKKTGFLKSGKTTQSEYEKMWATIKGGDKWVGEILNKKKNGDLYWEYATIAPIKSPENGEIIYFIKIGQDVTLFKEKSSEEREETAFYLDMITHDLNNYHFVTLGFLDVLKNLLPMPKETEKILLSAIENITRASSLLNSISILMRQKLSYSYELQSIDVVMAVNRVKRVLHQFFPRRKITIRAIMPPSGYCILADALFDELLLNLLTNAVKSDDNDTVNIDISLEKYENSNTCLLTVKDHGKGIPYGVYDMTKNQ